jgi:hypothetical protein
MFEGINVSNKRLGRLDGGFRRGLYIVIRTMSVHITFLRGLGVKTAGVYHGGLTHPYEGPLPCRLSSENEKLDRTASCTSLMNNIRQRLGGFQVKRAVVATRRGLMLVHLPGIYIVQVVTLTPELSVRHITDW